MLLFKDEQEGQDLRAAYVAEALWNQHSLPAAWSGMKRQHGISLEVMLRVSVCTALMELTGNVTSQTHA